MQTIHIPCTVQEIQTYEIESIFLNHAVHSKILDDLTEIQFVKFFHLQRYRRGDVSNL